MIDLHTHLLPGIDDGPGSMPEALEMARIAVGDGIATVVCTPHMHPRYPTAPERALTATAALQTELDAHGIPLRVVPGGEIALEWLPRMSDDDLRAASLGGTGRWLLLEPPWRGWPLQLPRVIDDLQIRGFDVLLAHPERLEGVQSNPDRMRDLVGRGALVQLTADSFLGEHGPRARAVAQALLRNGFAHVLASDAHSARWRPPVLAGGLRAAAASVHASPDELAWMVTEGPRAILAGETVRPPRLGRPRPRVARRG
jgi:protein-tyrosine phosphatase